MAIRYGERDQVQMFPSSIADYVSGDAAVRAYDAMVDAMDLSAMGIDTEERRVGNSRYDPRAMLKLLVYGISYGIRSSRKLERALHYNVSFMWLVGGLKPGYKAISEFRRTHKQSLAIVLKQVARMCIHLDLIAGNTLFVDGTKIRANASIQNTWTPERCERHLKRIDARIERLLEECEATDQSEDGDPSHVKLDEELEDQSRLKERVKGILSELQASGEDSLNSTDREANPMHGVQGSHASYNVQLTVDSKEGLIVSSDAVTNGADRGQLSGQLQQAEETLGTKPDTVCADAGYSDTDDLETISPETKVIVPSARQVTRKPPGPFDKQHFRYDKDTDCYICPEGKLLVSKQYYKAKGHLRYRPQEASTCKECRYWGVCTKAKKGRQISRLKNEEFREYLESVYEQEDSQAVYRQRKDYAEHPFGHIKHNLHMDGFLLRGLAGVRAELSLLASCFNIRRMITLCGGVQGLIARLREMVPYATT